MGEPPSFASYVSQRCGAVSWRDLVCIVRDGGGRGGGRGGLWERALRRQLPADSCAFISQEHGGVSTQLVFLFLFLYSKKK